MTDWLHSCYGMLCVGCHERWVSARAVKKGVKLCGVCRWKRELPKFQGGGGGG